MLRRSEWVDESGTGMVGTAFGAVVFLAFLLLATHTLIGLYTSSVVTSTAWDGARHVATNQGDAGAVAYADAQVRQRLRGLNNVKVDITSTPTDVALRVTASRPALLPATLAERTGLNTIDRTVHARAEAPR